MQTDAVRTQFENPFLTVIASALRIEPGDIRWMPTDPPPPRVGHVDPPDLTRTEWSGLAFARRRVTDVTPIHDGEALPKSEPAGPAKHAETARASSVLRLMTQDELPSVNRVVLVTDVTDEPGQYALRGIPLRGAYTSNDSRRPGRQRSFEVPVGSILAERTRVENRGPAGCRNELTWRIWRVPAKGDPFIEWEGPDAAWGRGWLPNEETPHERIARLLDDPLDDAFRAWIARLETADESVSPLTLSLAKQAYALWCNAVSEIPTKSPKGPQPRADRAVSKRRRRRKGNTARSAAQIMPDGKISFPRGNQV